MIGQKQRMTNTRGYFKSCTRMPGEISEAYGPGLINASKNLPMHNDNNFFDDDHDGYCAVEKINL